MGQQFPLSFLSVPVLLLAFLSAEGALLVLALRSAAMLVAQIPVEVLAVQSNPAVEHDPFETHKSSRFHQGIFHCEE
ncbi:MAG: hypothetical protein ACLR1R_12440 [Ruminococcus callidus]